MTITRKYVILQERRRSGEEQKLMFKTGNIAVYPAHGVVEVQGIEIKEICGTRRKYYILKVLDNDVTVMVPTE